LEDLKGGDQLRVLDAMIILKGMLEIGNEYVNWL
jgi:hypothetical protein